MATLRDLLHDDSPALLTRGYGFGSRIWQRVRAGARAAPMRLLGDEAMLVRGDEGVRVFYDESLVRRHGAMPAFIQETLFGHGSVHSLDGTEHRHRKATFVDVLYDDDEVARALPLIDAEWRAELDDWVAGGQRTAYEAGYGALGRAIMRWAGLPGTPAAQTRWSARLAQIVDGFGAPYSPAFVLSAINRWWSDRHAAELIDAVRSGALDAADGTALHAWAHHRDLDGELLPARLAGIELQNSMRPMIAVCRFVAFAAKALHEHPQWRERIAAETAERGTLVGGESATMFAQELRRTAPFVPVLPARAITEVELDGIRVPEGGRVVIDVLGTDLDDASWERAGEFDPERFRGVGADYEQITAFIPQGGGDVPTGHRCPGEKLAIAGLAAGVAALSDPRVEVLGDGLQVNRRRMPTKPASGGKIRPCPFH